MEFIDDKADASDNEDDSSDNDEYSDDGMFDYICYFYLLFICLY